jgi:hypothetical protein
MLTYGPPIHNVKNMDELVDVPQELKDAVRKRLKNGCAPNLAQQIKVGMSAALHELRDHKSVSSLEYHPLEGVENVELDAIQSIYQYLDSKGLAWTLACLIQESTIDHEAEALDLKDLLKSEPLEEADEEEDA